MTTSAILAPSNYLVDDVKDEDKNLIQDILSMLETTQPYCKNWQVSLKKTFYEITGTIDSKSNDWIIFFNDIDTIRQLNFSRIPVISVGQVGSVIQIRIHVIPHSERVVLYQTDVIRIQKKRKWYDLF
jgi:hypothetical protein